MASILEYLTLTANKNTPKDPQPTNTVVSAAQSIFNPGEDAAVPGMDCYKYNGQSLLEVKIGRGGRNNLLFANQLTYVSFRT